MLTSTSAMARVGAETVWLAGQVMDSARREPTLGNLPVAVAGLKSSLPKTTTNQFGEFFLEFRHEHQAQLRIGINRRHVILVPLEALEPMKSHLANSQPDGEAKAQ